MRMDCLLVSSKTGQLLVLAGLQVPFCESSLAEWSANLKRYHQEKMQGEGNDSTASASEGASQPVTIRNPKRPPSSIARESESAAKKPKREASALKLLIREFIKNVEKDFESLSSDTLIKLVERECNNYQADNDTTSDYGTAVGDDNLSDDTASYFTRLSVRTFGILDPIWRERLDITSALSVGRH
jgi:hypothetical protein